MCLSSALLYFVCKQVNPGISLRKFVPKHKDRIMTEEQLRLKDASWKNWGPYISDRQWGTVREDYSHDGDAWAYTTHDMARSKAYRWGEEGIAGICDKEQLLCFAIALWNKKDPIL